MCSKGRNRVTLLFQVLVRRSPTLIAKLLFLRLHYYLMVLHMKPLECVYNSYPGVSLTTSFGWEKNGNTRMFWELVLIVHFEMIVSTDSPCEATVSRDCGNKHWRDSSNSPANVVEVGRKRKE